MSPSKTKPRAFQAAFFRRMGLGQQFRRLFDHQADVHFFAKDLEGRFVAAGPGLLGLLGFSSEEKIWGSPMRTFIRRAWCATFARTTAG